MPSVAAVTGRIQGGKITQRSTLIVEGDVTIENLDLDGCLVIKAASGGPIVVKDLVVRNQGWEVHATLTHPGLKNQPRTRPIGPCARRSQSP